MKKRTLSLVLALALSLALPAFAASDSPYGLYVAGTAVTAANAADVLGDGTVRYDAAANTLYLTDAHIQGGAAHGIEYTGTGHLTVQGTGTNSIASDESGIWIGTGSLTLTGSFDRISGGSDGVLDFALGGVWNNSSITVAQEAEIRELSGPQAIQAAQILLAGTLDRILGKVGAVTLEISGTVNLIRSESYEVGSAYSPAYTVQADEIKITGTVGRIEAENTLDDAYTIGIAFKKSLEITGSVEIRDTGYALLSMREDAVVSGLPAGYAMHWGHNSVGDPILYLEKGGRPVSSLVVGRSVPTVVAIPMYWPQLEQASGGSVKASPLAGSEGATMNLLVTPAEGMVLEQLIVTDAAGQRIAVRASGENRWSFVQPASAVTVTPVFVHADPLEGFAQTDSAAPATRGDLAELLWRMAGKPVVNYLMRFSDVQQGDARAEAIRWAAAQKLMLGHGDGTFRPEEAITRQEAATVLYRWTQSRGGGFAGMWMFLLSHPDRMDVADWAYEAICWTTMHDILPCPDGMILPGDTITRADLAEMVNKMEG